MSNNSEQGTVKDLMGPRIDEIQRRKEAESTTFDDVTMFERVKDGKKDAMFFDETQQFVLFSLSSENMFPICMDAQQPGLMILGTFESLEEAVNHSKELTANGAKFSMLVNSVHRWLIAARSEKRLTDEKLMEEKLKRLQEEDKEERDRGRKEFEDNVKRSKSGSVSMKKEKNEVPVDITNKKGNKSKVSQGARDPSKRFAVISVICDQSGEDFPEFAFMVLQCFETCDEADKFVRNVVCLEIQDYNIHVVETCAWLFPQLMLTETVPNEVFRHSELDKVMSNHRTSSDHARAFEKEQEMQKKVVTPLHHVPDEIKGFEEVPVTQL